MQACRKASSPTARPHGSRHARLRARIQARHYLCAATPPHAWLHAQPHARSRPTHAANTSARMAAVPGARTHGGTHACSKATSPRTAARLHARRHTSQHATHPNQPAARTICDLKQNTRTKYEHDDAEEDASSEPALSMGCTLSSASVSLPISAFSALDETSASASQIQTKLLVGCVCVSE
jgi:hypothetical protein